MKKYLIALLTLSLAASCNSGRTHYVKPEDATDCFRGFVQATMIGDFDLAKEYMLEDSTNDFLFERLINSYQHFSEGRKDSLRNSSIIINETATVNDSVTVINFNNSAYPERKFPIMIIRKNNNFYVDLKYTQSGNM